MIKENLSIRIMIWLLDLFIPVLPLFVWHLNRRGIPVIFWVLNNEEDWDKAIKMGANGIMTDRPKALKHYIKLKNLWPKF